MTEREAPQPGGAIAGAMAADLAAAMAGPEPAAEARAAVPVRRQWTCARGELINVLADVLPGALAAQGRFIVDDLAGAILSRLPGEGLSVVATADLIAVLAEGQDAVCSEAGREAVKRLTGAAS